MHVASKQVPIFKFSKDKDPLVQISQGTEISAFLPYLSAAQ